MESIGAHAIIAMHAPLHGGDPCIEPTTQRSITTPARFLTAPA